MAASGVVFKSAASATAAYPAIFAGKAKRAVEVQLAQHLAAPYLQGLLRNWSEIEFRTTSATKDGRKAYRQAALVRAAEEHPGALIAKRLGAAVEWRRGDHEEWQREEPASEVHNEMPFEGVPAGVRSISVSARV